MKSVSPKRLVQPVRLLAESELSPTGYYILTHGCQPLALFSEVVEYEVWGMKPATRDKP